MPYVLEILGVMSGVSRNAIALQVKEVNKKLLTEVSQKLDLVDMGMI